MVPFWPVSTSSQLIIDVEEQSTIHTYSAPFNYTVNSAQFIRVNAATVSVCVCVRERERERGRDDINTYYRYLQCQYIFMLLVLLTLSHSILTTLEQYHYNLLTHYNMILCMDRLLGKCLLTVLDIMSIHFGYYSDDSRPLSPQLLQAGETCMYTWDDPVKKQELLWSFVGETKFKKVLVKVLSQRLSLAILYVIYRMGVVK